MFQKGHILAPLTVDGGRKTDAFNGLSNLSRPSGTNFERVMSNRIQETPSIKSSGLNPSFLRSQGLRSIGGESGSGNKRFKMTIGDYFKNALPNRSVGRSFVQRKGLSDGVNANPPLMELSKDDHPEIATAIQEISEKYKVPPKLIESIVKAESNFNPKAISRVGAQGLMQLMPGTAKEMGVSDSFDVRQNIEGGVKYFRKMLDMFGQDQKMALAAYNAGPGAVKRYGGIPPYSETRQYVTKILKRYNDSGIG